MASSSIVFLVKFEPQHYSGAYVSHVYVSCNVHFVAFQSVADCPALFIRITVEEHVAGVPIKCNSFFTQNLP